MLLVSEIAPGVLSVNGKLIVVTMEGFQLKVASDNHELHLTVKAVIRTDVLNEVADSKLPEDKKEEPNAD